MIEEVYEGDIDESGVEAKDSGVSPKESQAAQNVGERRESSHLKLKLMQNRQQHGGFKV